MDLRVEVSSLMKKNQRQKDGHFYTLPSPKSYPYQWFWDSCFHAIIYLRLGEVENAKKELLSLAAKQFRDGMIPHMIYWEKAKDTNFPEVNWGKEDTSSITQPPMLAYAVNEIYKVDHDKKFLRQMYKSMERFYGYLLEERDVRNHHLVSIINPDESGEDNSPRFDIPLGLPPKHTLDENFKRRLQLVEKNLSCDFVAKKCMSNFFWVKDVPFNAILVENLDILSKLANELGEREDAGYYETQRSAIGKAMRALMFEDGIFWTVYGLDYAKIKVKTWAIFAPMFAKLYTKKEADEVIRLYLLRDSEFNNRKFFLPTVSFDDPSYDPKGFWRGPIWMSTNWFVYKGLMNYRKVLEAKRIRNSSYSLLEKSGFREQFDPGTGEGLGAENFTWGGLVLDMI